jgi:hypothetical protein
MVETYTIVTEQGDIERVTDDGDTKRRFPEKPNNSIV